MEWNDEDINTLVRLWREGSSVQQIADVLGTSRSSVKMYVQRHKEELGLERRTQKTDNMKSFRDSFNKQWHGSVPYGHWLITKPWS